MSAIKAALHWSLLIAHCSLLTGLLVQCPLPLDPIPRRLLDPYLVAIELSHSSQNNSWTDFSKTHARRTQEARKRLARKVGTRSGGFPFRIPAALKKPVQMQRLKRQRPLSLAIGARRLPGVG